MGKYDVIGTPSQQTVTLTYDKSIHYKRLKIKESVLDDLIGEFRNFNKQIEIDKDVDIKQFVYYFSLFISGTYWCLCIGIHRIG